MKRTHIKCPVPDLLARSFLAAAAMLLTVSTTLAINYQSAVLGDAPQAYYRLGDLAPADVARNSGSLGTAGNGIHGPSVVHRVVGALVGGALTQPRVTTMLKAPSTLMCRTTRV